MSSVLDLVVGTGQMKHGRLFINHRRQFDQQLRGLDDRWTLEIIVQRLRATRSVQANRYYWGVVIATLCAHTGYTPDEMHDVLKMKFIPKRLALLDGNGEIHGEYVLAGSTRTMTTADFSEYVEAVKRFAAAELDCDIPDASEAA